MLSRFEFDRALSELSEYGIGFSEGKPQLVRRLKPSVSTRVMRGVTGYTVGVSLIVLLKMLWTVVTTR